ncbi:hypothetical protein HMPREF2532_01913 [Bacteroides ovatus]|uniref:Uncharacterized protein n=1 Tax=Bacteroides ovatus (strain ATCC 8483 / DSM 1896 / JCM 5824 / BCRC 10623 / CCUG 4943 / NCTC 11153) TaxID=411476 RepID=A0AAN3D5N1_BACO1|nr:hypothetical protein BACOVA_03710 [Bacteroides ovatus ATCC 8483]EEO57099.1 hypothetical protein BSCG_04027 [Bacteroides sp. 2_2_4]KXT47819.1 hypothetical protein HMPREF2532_01913 [Bacteroides ovatus]
MLSNSRTAQLLTVFTINIVTLSGEDSDGICQRYRHYPEHIPSLL